MRRAFNAALGGSLLAIAAMALTGCGDASSEGPAADFGGYVVKVSGMT